MLRLQSPHALLKVWLGSLIRLLARSTTISSLRCIWRVSRSCARSPALAAASWSASDGLADPVGKIAPSLCCSLPPAPASSTAEACATSACSDCWCALRAPRSVCTTASRLGKPPAAPARAGPWPHRSLHPFGPHVRRHAGFCLRCSNCAAGAQASIMPSTERCCPSQPDGSTWASAPHLIPHRLVPATRRATRKRRRGTVLTVGAPDAAVELCAAASCRL